MSNTTPVNDWQQQALEAGWNPPGNDAFPFSFKMPSWLNKPKRMSEVSAEESLVRAREAASAYYAIGVQTGVHSMIEWCGVMGEHVNMLKHAASNGHDPREIDQHHEGAVEVPGYMIAYFCEKLGCQIKPFIRANKEAWRHAINQWFEK